MVAYADSCNVVAAGGADILYPEQRGVAVYLHLILTFGLKKKWPVLPLQVKEVCHD